MSGNRVKSTRFHKVHMGAGARVLLINPPSTRRAYLATNVKVGAPSMPPMGLAVIASALIERNHSVALLDMDLADISDIAPDAALASALDDFNPDVAGITSITPTWHEMLRIARAVKAASPRTYVVAGGPHVTIFPEETLREGCVDAVALGEADYALADLADTESPAKTPGLAIIKYGGMKKTADRPLLEPDAIPVPAWELFHTGEYRMSRLTERRRPAGCIETSRGCPFNCSFCNKSIFGNGFRGKSPERVMSEIETMMDARGFREIHIIDDGFTTDLDRAKQICELIIRSGRKLSFNTFNGIRADRLDDELCALLKRAGCWQVAFGVESGNSEVLRSVSKGLTKDVIRSAVKMCKKHKLETFGFFMLGFPEDTRETILETINFAVELDMDISKYDIATPLPGTRMAEKMEEAGLIKSRDWSRYIFHATDTELFSHPSLSWDELSSLYKLAYRKTYLRAGYIAKRFLRGLRTGDIWYDFLYFIKSRWS